MIRNQLSGIAMGLSLLGAVGFGEHAYSSHQTISSELATADVFHAQGKIPEELDALSKANRAEDLRDESILFVAADITVFILNGLVLHSSLRSRKKSA